MAPHHSMAHGTPLVVCIADDELRRRIAEVAAEMGVAVELVTPDDLPATDTAGRFVVLQTGASSAEFGQTVVRLRSRPGSPPAIVAVVPRAQAGIHGVLFRWWFVPQGPEALHSLVGYRKSGNGLIVDDSLGEIMQALYRLSPEPGGE